MKMIVKQVKKPYSMNLFVYVNQQTNQTKRYASIKKWALA